MADKEKKETIKTVNIPEGVTFEINDKEVVVKGPKGELKRDFSNPVFNAHIKIEKKDSSVIISTPSEKKKTRAMVGTITAHLNNMANGVTIGFKYTMRIFSVHFPMNVTVKDNVIQIKNFLGEKTLRKAKLPENVDVKIDKDILTVRGINRETVGRTCGIIERAVRLSGKDRRIFQDGIFLETKGLDNKK